MVTAKAKSVASFYPVLPMTYSMTVTAVLTVFALTTSQQTQVLKCIDAKLVNVRQEYHEMFLNGTLI